MKLAVPPRGAGIGGLAAGVLALGLALYHLGSRSLWGDEAFSITLAKQPAAEFWRVVSQSQANMSLYYVLLRGWTTLGDGETWARLLSVLAAVAAVFVLYAVASRLFDPRVATAAALLLAANPFFLHYAQEARSYSLVVLLVTVATLLFVRIEAQSGAHRLEVLYVIAAALALYAHFFAVFVLGGHVLALVLARRPLQQQLVRLAAVGLCVLPLGFFAVFRDAGQISHLTRPTPRYVEYTLRQLAGGTRPLLLLYAAAVVLAAAAWLPRRGRRENWAMVVVATWAATPVGGALLASIGKPLFTPRFLIVALPGIALAVAVGLARLPAAATLAGVALVLALSVVQVLRTQGDQQEDFRAATAFVLAQARSGDAVAFYRTSRRIPFEYYARRTGARELPRTLFPTSPYGHFDLIDDYRHTRPTSAELAAIGDAARSGRVWLLLSRSESERVEEKRENRARLVAAVERRAELRLRRLFAGLEVRLYTPS